MQFFALLPVCLGNSVSLTAQTEADREPVDMVVGSLFAGGGVLGTEIVRHPGTWGLVVGPIRQRGHARDS